MAVCRMSCWVVFGSKELENTCMSSSNTFKCMIYTLCQITPAPLQVGLLLQQTRADTERHGIFHV